jgi:hypothetical protein
MITFRMKIGTVVLLAGTAVAPLAAQNVPGALIPSQDQPPTRQGTRGANFLQLGVGARAQAMAGAATGFVAGPDSWYWNPAGGVSMETFGIAASVQNLYDDLDISHNYAALGLPALGGVVGLHVIALNSGELTRTTEASPLGDDPTLGTTFEWNSLSIGASYARRLTDRLALGGTLKFVTEGLNDASLSWVALDLGTQFQTGIYGLTLGASLSNIGPSSHMRGALTRREVNTDDFSPQLTDVEYQTRETELPTLFRFSVASELFGTANSLWGQGGGDHAIFGEVAVSDAIDTDVQAAIGLEYGWRNMLFVRGGKRFYNDERDTGESSSLAYGLSGGFGLRLPVGGRGLRFDYAYTALGDQLQNIQVFSLEFGR